MTAKPTVNRIDANMLDSHTPARRGDTYHQPVNVEPCSCAFVGGDAKAHVYNEEAFRYFLEIERKRSEASNRPFLLLLLDLKRRTHGTDIDTGTAERLFAALATCLRETDFIGWYRAGSVVGAVLTQHVDDVSSDVQETVRRRVVDVVRKRVSLDLSSRVQVRVYQASPAPQI